MRIALALFAATLAVTSASAKEASVYDQYAKAQSMFVGASSSPADYLADFPKQVFEGLDGTWFRIGAVAPQSDDPALFASACARTGVNITVRDAFSVDFTIGADADNTMTTTYSARGGNAFTAYADPAAVAKRLGIDPAAQGDILISALNGTNGTATMARPSPDVLVVQTNYGMPQIFGRCAE